MGASKFKKDVNLNQLYPDYKARASADKAIDDLPMTSTLSEAVDAYDEAYVKAGGVSPWRKRLA